MAGYKVRMKNVYMLKEGLLLGCQAYSLDVSKTYPSGSITITDMKFFDIGYKISCNKACSSLWAKNVSEYELLQFLINTGDIVPVDWKISKCIDSNFRPFVEEK